MNIFIIITVVIVCLIAIVLGLVFGLKTKKNTPTSPSGSGSVPGGGGGTPGDNKKYKCNNNTGRCEEDKDGTMNKTYCDKSCTITPGPVPPTDPCLHKNCGDHGTCEHGKCICDDGWTGDSCQTPTGPSPTPPDFPKSIKGYYVWSWTRDAQDAPVTGPSGSNIGITFAGAKVTNTQKLYTDKPMTNNKINLLSVGGGKGSDGELQSFNKDDVTAYIKLIDTIKTKGYDGVCFDIESGTATKEEYINMFTQTKQNGLIVMVTISYFCNAVPSSQEYLHSIMNELVQDVLTKPEYVDILSPQLYSGNCDEQWHGTAGGGDWNGYYMKQKTKDAYKNCLFLAPTINTNNWADTLKVWKTLGLPDPLGYFQYCNLYIQ